MKFNLWLGLCLVVTLFLIGITSALSITTFNNSLSAENISMDGINNVTRYLAVPSLVTLITNGSLVLTYPIGVGSYAITSIYNFAGVFNKTFWINESASNGGSYITQANSIIDQYLDCSAGGVCDSKLYTNTTNDLFYNGNNITIFYNVSADGSYAFPGSAVNVTLFLGGTKLPIFNYNPNTGNFLNQYVNIYRFSNGSTMYTSSSGGNSGSSTATGNASIRFVQHSEEVNTHIHINIYGLNLTTPLAANNLSLSIGGTDVFSNQVNASGTNVSSTIIGLQTYINNYLSGCTITNGFCNVPFTFEVYTPITIGYSNLNFSNAGFIENNQAFNSSTYETASESFNLNLSYDSSSNTISSANLIYNGVNYAGNILTSGSNAMISRVFDVPTVSSTTNNTFLWQIGFSDGSYYNSTLKSQIVAPINFSNCYTTPAYINYSFVDETTLLAANGTISNMQMIFYLGSGTQAKTFVFQNVTSNPSYAFCFNPITRPVTASLSFTYAGTNYAPRFYSTGTQQYTNSTTNTILYLLGTSSGITTSIQTVSTAQTPITGVDLLIERQISGIWTTIGQSTTDSSGLASFFVNPNFPIRVTGTKTGYTTTTQTITPTQGVYTLIMQQIGVNGGAYNGTLEGMSWRISPPSGILSSATIQTFSVNITASLGNLQSCKIELFRADTEASLGSGTGTGAFNCSASLTIAVPSSRIFGRISIITPQTNGQYMIIESDAMWILLETNVNQASVLSNFFSQMKNLPMWGSDSNHQEYTRLVSFFVILMILMAIFSYFTQYDAIYPGIGIFLVWAMILLANWGGWFVMNFGNSTLLSNPGFQQWAIFIIASLFLAGYAINYWAGRIQGG